MSQSQEKKNENVATLSLCDIIRDNTNNIIMKVESLGPTYIGNITDLQTEYLRIARDFFGTCYLSEKELFDKIGMDQKSIDGFDDYLKKITKFVISQIEIINNSQKIFGNNLISCMKIYDDYVKLMLSSYAKMLEYTSSLLPEKQDADLGKKALATLS